MRRKSVFFVLLVSSPILFTLVNDVVASSEEWIEVKRFTNGS